MFQVRFLRWILRAMIGAALDLSENSHRANEVAAAVEKKLEIGLYQNSHPDEGRGDKMEASGS